MNEENYTCEICYENYDLKNENKLPKKVPCCNKTFCLSCLNDIYKRNNQQIKCPNCRKFTPMPPKYLMNNPLVFSRFLICCNCHEKVPQNQLFFHKNSDDVQIKCQKCEKGDMKLDDILPDFVSELNTDLKIFENSLKSDVLELIKNKIEQEIDEYFENIKQNLIQIMTKNILINFGKINLEKRQKEFKNMISQFNQSYKYLNAFIEDDATKNFDSKKVLNCIKYYNDNITKIKNELNFFEKTKKWLNNNCLIAIKDDFEISQIEGCFMTAFDKINNKNENRNNNLKNNIIINSQNKIDQSNSSLKDQEKNDNKYYNDKLLKELDKLIIKTKVDKSNNYPRI
jgi:hypothetical protein